MAEDSGGVVAIFGVALSFEINPRCASKIAKGDFTKTLGLFITLQKWVSSIRIFVWVGCRLLPLDITLALDY